MKYFISSILCCIFFCEFISVCYCCVCCAPNQANEIHESILPKSKDEIPEFSLSKPKNEIPEWISSWESLEYGLECQDVPELMKTPEAEFEDIDKNSIIDDEKIGMGLQNSMKKKLNTYIAQQHDGADFVIARMDPIEYKYKDKNMWLLLKNIKFRNLDSYDKNLSFYHQSPTVHVGEYKINKNRFFDVDRKKDRKPLDENKYVVNGEFVYYKRRDVSWNIDLSAFFINENAPVKMEAEFQIQPKPEQLEPIEGVRQKGTVELKFDKFYFNIHFVITHIDDKLRDFLAEEKQCNNRVPDFSVEYHSTGITIENVTVQKYDEDILEWHIPEQPSDVNVKPPPSEDQMKVKITKAPKNEEQSETTEEDKIIATNHLNAIKKFILEEKDIIKQKLCMNMMPKITWKIMQMNSKLELQSLLYEVVKYKESFNPRSPLPAADKNLWNAGFNVVGAFLKRTNSKSLSEERKKKLKEIFGVEDPEKNEE